MPVHDLYHNATHACCKFCSKVGLKGDMKLTAFSPESLGFICQSCIDTPLPVSLPRLAVDEFVKPEQTPVVISPAADIKVPESIKWKGQSVCPDCGSFIVGVENHSCILT